MPDLPSGPDLNQLRHQAKDLLHAAQRGDPRRHGAEGNELARVGNALAEAAR